MSGASENSGSVYPISYLFGIFHFRGNDGSEISNSLANFVTRSQKS